MLAAPTDARFCERAARLYGQERNGDLSPGALGRYVANSARWARGGLARQPLRPSLSTCTHLPERPSTFSLVPFVTVATTAALRFGAALMCAPATRTLITSSF